MRARTAAPDHGRRDFGMKMRSPREERDFMAQFPGDSVTAGSPHAPKPSYDLNEPPRRGKPMTAATVVAIYTQMGVILFFTLAARP